MMTAFKDVIEGQGTITHNFTKKLWAQFQYLAQRKNRGGHSSIDFADFCR